MLPSRAELGLDSFGEVAVDASGTPLSPAQTVRLLVEEGVLADEVGLDFYNIGEHYKPDFVDTAGHVILGAIAARTKRIKLGTSVATPQSVVRAANYGLPLMIAIIGGAHRRFLPPIDLYERALEQLGKPKLPVGVHSLGLIAGTDGEAMDRYGPRWLEVFSAHSVARGYPPPHPRQFEAEVAEGSLFVGSPETVARKLAKTIRDLRISRFDLKYDLLYMPVGHRAESVRLFGSEVAPRVRELLSA